MYNILYIDNELLDPKEFIEIFQKHTNEYKLTIVKSEEEAFEHLYESSFDLLIIGISSESFDSFKMAQDIKSLSKFKYIPIIFLTKAKDELSIKKSFELGIDCVTKPFHEYELLARIKSHIEFFNTKKELDEEVSFAKAIINYQGSKIFVVGSNGVVTANRSFLDFFQVNDVEEFNDRYGSISDLFMEYEHYFSKHILNNGREWTSFLDDQSSDEYNVLIMDIATFEPKAFKIDVHSIDNSDKYVVTLTDITTLTAKSNEYEKKATYDLLTDIYNRTKFNEIIEDYYKQFKRYKTDISFAIFDIDFFKKVNDTYGHLVGDQTLKIFAKTIDGATRDTDSFARWGGEEFVLLMPQTSLEQAKIAVEKLRKLIEQTSFPEVEHITCSVGVSQFEDGDTIDDLLHRADEALYIAKESGRNQVVTKV